MGRNPRDERVGRVFNGHRQSRSNAWTGLLVAALWAALLLTVLGSGIAQAAWSGSGETVAQGIVLKAADSPTGVGSWEILKDSNVAVTVTADAATEFHDGEIPTVGTRVEVRGMSLTDGTIRATRMERLDGAANSSEQEWEGRVLTAPLTGAAGNWIIQSDAAMTLTVVATGATRFDKGIPLPGDWVEVEGILQDDGSVVAERIRPDDYEAGEVILRLAASAVSGTVAARYDLDPVSTVLASAHIYLFATDDDEASLVDHMAGDADILWAELNYVNGVPEGDGYKTWGWGGFDDGGYVNQHAYVQVQLDPALEKATGNGVRIAVLDTGVDYQHPALAGHLDSGIDLVADDDVAQDEGNGVAWGHGTHVAGVVARVAPEATIVPIRVLDSNGRGNVFTLAYAIDWAVDRGVDVINLSLGAEADSRVLEDVVRRADAQGVVIVAAAGNRGSDELQYPAGYAPVIGVTAVDENGIKPGFASYGRQWVDVAAPGVGIASTVIGPQGSGYASWSGTSMAAPFVSGTAALVQQLKPESRSADVSTWLRESAGDLDAANPQYAGQLGGLLNAGAAVEAAASPEDEFVQFLPILAR